MYARYLTSLRRILKLIIKSLTIQIRTKKGAEKYKTAVIDKKEANKYKTAAINYPKRLEPWSNYYLFIKPFDNAGHKDYSALFFYHFANIIKILELPQKAKILDVACGPGWLCEFLGRSGYDVTGIDISPDMINIAKERIQAIKFGPQKGHSLQIEFLVEDAENTDLGSELYHAAIFYDALHHFTEPLAILERVLASLKSGGKLYIQEGIKPAPGSELEQHLIKEMNQFGTLEKPFDQSELFGILKKVGFVNLQAYEAVNLIVKREGRKIEPSLRNSMVPMTNTVVARKPGNLYDSQFPHQLKARISIDKKSIPQIVFAGAVLQLEASLKNEGDTLWLSDPNSTTGFVTIGTKLLDERRQLLSDALERSHLPHNVPPGQTVALTHRFTAPTKPGLYWIKLDLVDEQIAWFEEEGSQPLIFSIQVR